MKRTVAILASLLCLSSPVLAGEAAQCGFIKFDPAYIKTTGWTLAPLTSEQKVSTLAYIAKNLGPALQVTKYPSVDGYLISYPGECHPGGCAIADEAIIYIVSGGCVVLRLEDGPRAIGKIIEGTWSLATN